MAVSVNTLNCNVHSIGTSHGYKNFSGSGSSCPLSHKMIKAGCKDAEEIKEEWSSEFDR